MKTTAFENCQNIKMKYCRKYKKKICVIIFCYRSIIVRYFLQAWAVESVVNPGDCCHDKTVVEFDIYI